jgi:hypothetical protein
VLGQARAVRRDRQILGAVQLGKTCDDLDDIAPQQRLAAGQPQLLYAELEKDARDALDLAGRQPVRARQELMVLAEDLGRHAIRAAVIAAVDHRDAQIPQRPHEPILDGCLRLPMSYGFGHLRGSANKPLPLGTAAEFRAAIVTYALETNRAARGRALLANAADAPPAGRTRRKTERQGL